MNVEEIIKPPIPVVTIDGPSGTGKGTVCHRLAKILGWHVLDSGVIYRALALYALQQAVDPRDLERYVLLAETLPLRFLGNEYDHPLVYLGEQEISALIRAEHIGQEASRLAAFKEVRLALLTRQRAFAVAPGLVTDGRDMGTVVFPKAPLKVYLFATPQERALRRFLQLKEKGTPSHLPEIIEELAIRDERDRTRATSPLVPAPDAVQIDTSGLTIVHVMKSILQLAAERGLYRSEGNL